MHKALHKLQPLGKLLTKLLASSCSHLLLDLIIQILQIRLFEEFLDGLGTHSRNEDVAVLILSFPKLRFR
jgi:hypothetical protein